MTRPPLFRLPRGTLFAAAVHLFTASGVVWGLLALIAAVNNAWTEMFVWLGIALFVDAVDGPLARKARVREVLPDWDGEVLDLVVDYITYVFVPAYALAMAGLVPDAMAIPCAALVCLSAAAFFANRNQKTRDNYFVGFPTIWNLVVFYFFLFSPPGWLSVTIVIALSLLTVAPIAVVHPVRVAGNRPMTLILLGVWSALAIAALLAELQPRPLVEMGLVLTTLYFVGVSLKRTVDGARADPDETS